MSHGIGSTLSFSLTSRISLSKAVVFFACLPLLLATLRANETPPRLERKGDAVQLLVNGEPFLALAGELGNSSGEPDYLRPFWPRLKAMHLNTVLAPVYWHVIEPTEGAFDFSTVDGLIRDARANQMHLVLLWFGAWKNSMSCYAPGWVKADYKRFPRCRDSAGRPLEILTPLSAENVKADAKAFQALMRHLKETDAQEQTVIMM